MSIEILDKLRDNGDLRILAENGLISISVLNYQKIYHAFMDRREHVNVSQAVTDIAEVFSVSEKTVYNVIRRMKKQAES